MDKDALIADIGRLIANDTKVDARPWDAFSLIAWYGDHVRKINGFRYVGDAPGKPATPAATAIGERVEQLRDATRVEGQAPWSACIVRLDRRSKKIVVDFEYDAPAQWEVTPATVVAIAERARPAWGTPPDAVRAQAHTV